jgi:hypothetical protein
MSRSASQTSSARAFVEISLRIDAIWLAPIRRQSERPRDIANANRHAVDHHPWCARQHAANRRDHAWGKLLTCAVSSGDMTASVGDGHQRLPLTAAVG